MNYSVPIPSLFTQVFGISGLLIKAYKINQEEAANYNPAYTVKLADESDPDQLTSNMGTPVQFPMGFIGDYEYNIRRNGRIEKKLMKGTWLPFTSVASFSRNKRITETFMSGQNGSVIEEYGFEPWEIRIQGLILKNDKALTNGDSTVEQQIRELLDWEGLSDAIKVKGRGFEVRNIHRVALLGISFPEAKNYNIEVVQPYEMRLRSVEPIELVDL